MSSLKCSGCEQWYKPSALANHEPPCLVRKRKLARAPGGSTPPTSATAKLAGLRRPRSDTVVPQAAVAEKLLRLNRVAPFDGCDDTDWQDNIGGVGSPIGIAGGGNNGGSSGGGGGSYDGAGNYDGGGPGGAHGSPGGGDGGGAGGGGSYDGPGGGGGSDGGSPGRGHGGGGGGGDGGSPGGGGGGGPLDFDSDDGEALDGEGAAVVASGAAALDAHLANPAAISNTLIASAAKQGRLSRAQLRHVLNAIHHPCFDQGLLLADPQAVLRAFDASLEAFGKGTPPFTRVSVPCADLELPKSSPKDPFVIVFDIPPKLAAVLRDPAIVRASRLHLDVSGLEPSKLALRAPVVAGSACFSVLGRSMDAACRALHASSKERVLPLLCLIQLDAARASRFGNIMVFPVVLILLTLMRPFRYRERAVVTIAFLPVVSSKDEDTDDARVGATVVLQRALRIAVVEPIAKLWQEGFVVGGNRGFDAAVRAVVAPHIVVSDHAGLTSLAAVFGSACIECISKPGDANYLHTNPAAHPRRTIAAANAARAAAAAAPTKAGEAAALSAMSLRLGGPCAFDDWTLGRGPWAGDLFGLARRSALDPMHHFKMGYDKFCGDGFDAVFGTCANFVSPRDWRDSQAALVRFIQSQPCFDTGVEQRGLLSLRNWKSITWWSAEARWADVVMRTAALLAVTWPFKAGGLQQRLVSVGVNVLHMQALASPSQWPEGHEQQLQAAVQCVHRSFANVEPEFGFSIATKRKGHNALVHMVPAARLTGVASEADCGSGVESVHPLNKLFFALSSKKGLLQGDLAKAHSREDFAVGDLAQALSRAADSARAATGAGGVADCDDERDSEDDADDGLSDAGPLSGTCAYATGALVRGMHIEGLSSLPQLPALLSRLLPRYCADFHGENPRASMLHASRPFDSSRCYLRSSLAINRDDVVHRRLDVDPLSELHPCLQLFQDVAGAADEQELDPNGFCEVLLIFSYDVRPGRCARFSERALAASEADEMVLVRMLPVHAHKRNAAFVRCSVPGPSLDMATAPDFKHFKLLPLSTLARPRAAFPAAARFLDDLPVGDLTPWSCAAVNVFLLI